MGYGAYWGGRGEEGEEEVTRITLYLFLFFHLD